jgi:hypothetical protein
MKKTRRLSQMEESLRRSRELCLATSAGSAGSGAEAPSGMVAGGFCEMGIEREERTALR